MDGSCRQGVYFITSDDRSQLSNPFPPVTDYFLLGTALKSHGTSGWLRVMVAERLKRYFRPGNFIFFQLDCSKVPFQITDVEDGPHFVIALEGIATKEESDHLSGKEIWIPEDQISMRHIRIEEAPGQQWHGYVIHDVNSGKSFLLQRTEEFPQQLMAVVELEDREVLIPLHQNLMLEIDEENRIIRMDIPEGLLDL